ncbi:tetratricopeptide repeat protein [Entomospira culicis]|uniref:Tetratricopeptide repeat protein n=1 Tax=Entomospira culicis TaxID=2719989 RepID=A0A968GF39_9SPIO|nr:tetratricopeptide repeat protein [Entomospira culicis]NIZ18648.1 tetratricopeptide repeat protein [Entomospira culicis]NIZ68863.1 tetratricopeptide repeat protein [Entomospira culicis]WDI37457.1 tetratricopeptide repeat protein [Entomospira culicis]WDI39085.1 tetratricopeptide repeat protein [Entomospira culicis]
MKQGIVRVWFVLGVNMLWLISSCATQSMESEIEQILNEYSATSSHGQRIAHLTTLSESQLWALLVDASEGHHYDRGLAIAVQLLEFQPENDSIYHEMGYFLTQKNRINPAIAMFQKAIYLNKENHAAHYNLGEIYLSQRKLSQAQAMLKQAHLIEPEEHLYAIQLAKLYVMQHYYEVALVLYLDIITQIESGKIALHAVSQAEYVMFVDVYYDTALVYLHGKDDATQADVYLKKYEALMPDDDDARVLRLQIEQRLTGGKE